MVILKCIALFFSILFSILFVNMKISSIVKLFAFNEEEIKNALAERKARLENRKAKELARSSSRTAPAQSGFASDIGF